MELTGLLIMKSVMKLIQTLCPTYELPNIEAKSKGFNLNYAELGKYR